MTAPGSFSDKNSLSGRREAASSLPSFPLTAASPEVPRIASDGLSPLSGAHTGGSQGSNAATAGLSSYYGQQVSGSWAPPTTTGAYTFSSTNQGHQSLTQPGYPGRPMYGSTPPLPYNARTSQPPTTTAESLPAPAYDQLQHPFSGQGSNQAPTSLPPTLPSSTLPSSLPTLPSSLPPSASSQAPPPPHSAILNSQNPNSQPPVSASTAAHSDPYAHARPPSYYPPVSTPQQSTFPTYAPPHPSPNQHPPPGSATPGRGIPTMAPPQSYQAAYSRYHHQLPGVGGGPILSNINNPGGQMSLVPGIGVHHAYGHMSHMYPHGQPQQQQERPFKCDQCTQSFNRNHDLKRHKRIHLAVKPFPCNYCEKSFSRKDALKRHRLVKGCTSPDKAGGDGSNTNGRLNDASSNRSDLSHDDMDGEPMVKNEL